MQTRFFSRSAELAIGGALVGILAWAAVQLGPVALTRWF
jgi:hypothetical protein